MTDDEMGPEAQARIRTAIAKEVVAAMPHAPDESMLRDAMRRCKGSQPPMLMMQAILHERYGDLE